MIFFMRACIPSAVGFRNVVLDRTVWGSHHWELGLFVLSFHGWLDDSSQVYKFESVVSGFGPDIRSSDTL